MFVILEWPMLSHFVLLRKVLVLDMLPIAPRYRLVLPAEVEDQPPSVPMPFLAVEGVRLLLSSVTHTRTTALRPRFQNVNGYMRARLDLPCIPQSCMISNTTWPSHTPQAAYSTVYNRYSEYLLLILRPRRRVR